MIALFLLQATLGPIGQQPLPATGCAAYLWSVSDRELVAMAAPERLRIQLNGKTLDLPRTAADGTAGLGLAATTHYQAGEVAATLELTVSDRGDVAKGAWVPEATLTVAPAGRDAIVTPLGGMVGCA